MCIFVGSTCKEGEEMLNCGKRYLYCAYAIYPLSNNNFDPSAFFDFYFRTIGQCFSNMSKSFQLLNGSQLTKFNLKVKKNVLYYLCIFRGGRRRGKGLRGPPGAGPEPL